MPTSSPITLIRESRPLARFPHRCTVCGQPIAIGTQYSCVIVRDNDRKDKNRNLISFKWHLPSCPSEVLR